jgi:hypothetical protein
VGIQVEILQITTGEASYTYNNAGRHTDTLYPDNTVVSYGYDLAAAVRPSGEMAKPRKTTLPEGNWPFVWRFGKA